MRLQREATLALRCICGASDGFELMHVYEQPPVGETHFTLKDAGSYRRELRRCGNCGHFVLSGTSIPAESYRGAYAQQTYGSGACDGVAAIRRGFERVQALPVEESDNAGRVQRVDAFARRWLGADIASRKLLDVGAGLGVFIDGMQKLGWKCTGVDPDPDACTHLRDSIGAMAHNMAFEEFIPRARVDVLALNKVLEHVTDPVRLLARCPGLLAPRGVVYVEVPDGEAALADSPLREEFFIEHLHAFSLTSLGLMMHKAGLVPIECTRLREPSGKYTLFAFGRAAHDGAAVDASHGEGAD